jgi:hypothetical protein
MDRMQLRVCYRHEPPPPVEPVITSTVGAGGVRTGVKTRYILRRFPASDTTEDAPNTAYVQHFVVSEAPNALNGVQGVAVP